MKASQVKGLLIAILIVTVLNLVALGAVLANLTSVKTKVANLNGGSTDASQLSSIQSSLTGLTTKVNSLPAAVSPSPSASLLSKDMTCTGTLNLSLSGMILSNENVSLDSTTPVDLTCNQL